MLCLASTSQSLPCLPLPVSPGSAPSPGWAAVPTHSIARQQEASRSCQHLEILLPCLVDHQPHAGDLGRDMLRPVAGITLFPLLQVAYWQPWGPGKGCKSQFPIPSLGPGLVVSIPGKVLLHSHPHRCP